METSNVFRLNRDRISASQPGLTASVSASRPKPKLLDQVRQGIRTRHYSPKTEESYVHWIKRFIFFHNKRHPAEMREKEIAQFLSSPRQRIARGRFNAEPGVERYFISLPRRVAKRDRVRRRCYSCETTAQTTGGFDTTGSEVHSRYPRSFRLANGDASLRKLACD
jgi:Phage integrase, N-terminal SAM-like domain